MAGHKNEQSSLLPDSKIFLFFQEIGLGCRNSPVRTKQQASALKSAIIFQDRSPLRPGLVDCKRT